MARNSLTAPAAPADMPPAENIRSRLCVFIAMHIGHCITVQQMVDWLGTNWTRPTVRSNIRELLSAMRKSALIHADFLAEWRKGPTARLFDEEELADVIYLRPIGRDLACKYANGAELAAAVYGEHGTKPTTPHLVDEALRVASVPSRLPPVFSTAPRNTGPYIRPGSLETLTFPSVIGSRRVSHHSALLADR